MNQDQAADFMSVIETFPVEMKTDIIERLLRSMEPPDAHLDALWIEEIRRRMADVRSGKSRLIPGDVVFAKIEERFGR